MSYADEFQTVDLLESSLAETRGVDAFALSLIKAERQIRKIFTHLMFQYPAFTAVDYAAFRGVLAGNRNVYFIGFIRGIDQLHSKTVRDLIGPEYDALLRDIEKATDYRNKIFHGQLTDKQLTRDELFTSVKRIRRWCETLASAAQKEFGYDGFARNSLHKSAKLNSQTFKVAISNLEDYRDFIGNHMER